MDSRRTSLIKTMLRNFFSELIGTAILVFLGCLGVGKGLGQKSDETGVVLSFAMAVFVAIQVTCHNSGGHVNPAVTILSLFFKKLDIAMAAVYIVGQILGGIIGFGFLKAITPADKLHANGFEQHGLCSTVPNPDISVVQALLSEFLLTSILLLVVCSAWDPRNAHHDSMSVKFGFSIYSLAYAGGAYSGCSMNPARSFAPAIWNQTWTHHWIYWVGPIFSGIFCGFVYTIFFCPKAPVHFPSSQKLNSPKDELEMNTS
ncbi:hypothetical protein RUM44_004699 [Polyplax serrata]|uniref:Uncharacterized protein n=1 Tax=Polyplax serrata TaxID=468196 RepID=A0ABR1B3J6_POLSC